MKILFGMLNDDYDNSFRPLHTGGIIYPRSSGLLTNTILEHRIPEEPSIKEIYRKVVDRINRDLNRRSVFIRR